MIYLAPGMPVAKRLNEAGILVGTGPVGHALQVAIVNLMPDKITAEFQLLRLLATDGRPLKVDFIRMQSHQSKQTPPEYLNRFYETLADIKNRHYDVLIITGAPVEKLDFGQVTYWKELGQLMEWSKTGASQILYICWGAQAGLYHHYQIPKKLLRQKLSGVYSHTLNTRHPFLKGFAQNFKAPHSRWTAIDEDRLGQEPDLEVLAHSQEAGLHLVADKSNRHLFMLGHMEYEADTLAQEYERDLKKGMNPKLPASYFPENNPHNMPPHSWAQDGERLFQNWLGQIKK